MTTSGVHQNVHDDLVFIRKRAHPNADVITIETYNEQLIAYPPDNDVAHFLGQNGVNIPKLINVPSPPAGATYQVNAGHIARSFSFIQRDLVEKIRDELVQKVFLPGRHFSQVDPDSASKVIEDWFFREYGFYCGGSLTNVKEFEKAGLFFERSKCLDLDRNFTFKILRYMRDGAIHPRLHSFLVAIAWYVCYVYLQELPQARLILVNHPRDSSGRRIQIDFHLFRTQLLALNAAKLADQRAPANSLFTLNTNMLDAEIRLGDGSIVSFAKFMHPLYPRLVAQAVVVSRLAPQVNMNALEQKLTTILDAAGLPGNRDVRSFGIKTSDFFHGIKMLPCNQRPSDVLNNATALHFLAYTIDPTATTAATRRLHLGGVLDRSRVLYNNLLNTHVFEARVASAGLTVPNGDTFLASPEGRGPTNDLGFTRMWH